jgi:hypothetical protein
MLLSIIIRIEHYFIVSGVERKFVAIKAINDLLNPVKMSIIN